MTYILYTITVILHETSLTTDVATFDLDLYRE